MRGIRITGWGIAVPDKVVTNDDLAVSLDTSDEWIVERTGIKERHIGGTTSGLAIEAAQEALACAGRTAAEIDNLVLATTTPDCIVPGTAPTVQHGIGMRGGAFDLNAACSGFVYGLITVAGLIAIGLGSGPAGGLRDPLAHHGHGRPQDRRDRGRRRRRRGRRAGGRAGHPPELEHELGRVGQAPLEVRARRHTVHGRQGSLPPGRPRGGRVGRAGHGRRRPGSPTTSL